MMLAAIGVGGQVLTAILEPAHRMAAAKREPAEADFLGEQDSLVAKAAADVGRDDPDAAFLQAEAFGEAGANDMRHLACGMEHELVGAMVEHGDRAAPLDRRHALAPGRDRARDLDRRIEGRGDAGVDESLEEDVVAPVLVHERGARLARRPHVADGRQLLEVQSHARRDILSFSARWGDAHGDELADMPDLAGRQRRLLGDLEAGQSRHRPDRSDGVQVRGGEHPAPNGFGDVDAANSGVGERAADEGHILHAGQPNIADILPQAPHQALVLLAGQPRADALRGFGAASVSQCETSSIRRCAARTSWPFGRRNCSRMLKWSAPAIGSSGPGA